MDKVAIECEGKEIEGLNHAMDEGWSYGPLEGTPMEFLGILHSEVAGITMIRGSDTPLSTTTVCNLDTNGGSRHQISPLGRHFVRT